MEQLAQFVTKSFEFNNCFLANKILELQPASMTAAHHRLNTLDASELNYSVSSNSSLLSTNASLSMDTPAEDERLEGDTLNLETDYKVQKCENSRNDDDEDDIEEEIDIETAEDAEDVVHATVVVTAAAATANRKISVIDFSAEGSGNGSVLSPGPTDLSPNRLLAINATTMTGTANDEDTDNDCDLNNNASSRKPKKPLTKNWLISDPMPPSKKSDTDAGWFIR